MKLTFTAISQPECEQFLRIRADSGVFQSINDFIRSHPKVSEELLDTCVLSYRGKEIAYKKYLDEYADFSDSMGFIRFEKPVCIIDEPIIAAAYFTQKAIECLQFARFFTMKSALLIDTDYNIHWSQGYVPQYLFRCIYFGTSTTWFSNAFDHVLQSIYWAKELYTSVKDRNDQPYDITWDKKRIMENCTYEFVVGELKLRGLKECREHLTSCSAKIEEVRKWANYIKHKGGIDYKYLMAESPYKVYIVPAVHGQNAGVSPTPSLLVPDEKYEVKDFKSPIEIDIDEKLKSLVDAHAAIYHCINETIVDIDYENYSVKI